VRPDGLVGGDRSGDPAGHPPGPPADLERPRRTAAGELPQALTHLALISAAFNLDGALGAVITRIW